MKLGLKVITIREVTMFSYSNHDNDNENENDNEFFSHKQKRQAEKT